MVYLFDACNNIETFNGRIKMKNYNKQKINLFNPDNPFWNVSV